MALAVVHTPVLVLYRSAAAFTAVQSSMAVARGPLGTTLRVLQVSIVLVFFSDAYCYSAVEAFLGTVLTEQGYRSSLVALGYASYAITNIAANLLILMLQAIPCIAQASPGRQFAVSWLSFAGCCVLSVVPAIVWPYSAVAVIVTRSIQGCAAAVFTVNILVIMVKVFPAEYQTQAIAAHIAGEAGCCPCMHTYKQIHELVQQGIAIPTVYRTKMVLCITPSAAVLWLVCTTLAGCML